ncbi:MAG: LysR substrate-binding domain-containing protein, partial [Acidithiobacillus sp.]|nr:LysR substrate-binding domain-containing protein [Acidithiobacillus sp.]
HILMELADSNAVFSAVLAGLGLGFLFSAFAEIQRPGIVFRPLADALGDSEVSLAWRGRQEDGNPAALTFVSMAQQRYALHAQP